LHIFIYFLIIEYPSSKIKLAAALVTTLHGTTGNQPPWQSGAARQAIDAVPGRWLAYWPGHWLRCHDESIAKQKKRCSKQATGLSQV